jgi:hypothetical protein
LTSSSAHLIDAFFTASNGSVNPLLREQYRTLDAMLLAQIEDEPL